MTVKHRVIGGRYHGNLIGMSSVTQEAERKEESLCLWRANLDLEKKGKKVKYHIVYRLCGNGERYSAAMRSIA